MNIDQTGDLRDALDLLIGDMRGNLHTSFPAKVLAYDAEAQTVDVRPAIRREITTQDGGVDYLSMPDLYAVQIMWPRAGGFAITFPISVGDWVKVTCAEQSTMAWRRNGVAPSNPGISDPHGLNGLVAEVGWVPDGQRLTNVNTERLEIRSADGATKVAIDGSTVTLGNDTGAQYVALANLVRAAIEAAITGHTHVVPSAGTSDPGVLTGTVAQVAATQVRAA